jgi:uncharacterized repeat protein (TIGR03803 family)
MRKLSLVLCSILFVGCSKENVGSLPLPVGPNGGMSTSRVTSNAYALLYSFECEPDGALPRAGLVELNGTFYGATTSGGGAGKCYDRFGSGTVFALSPSGSESVIYRFQGWSRYGEKDGADPTASLIAVDGTLYGTTYDGGANKNGIVFALSTSGSETVLYSFKGVPDGAHPNAGLIAVNGNLYGTTEYGGRPACTRFGCGTVFEVSPSGSESVIHRFRGRPDGSNPIAGLIAANGDLYGTTEMGGNGFGTLFKVLPSGKERALYSFNGGTDGAHPNAGLILVNGDFYGTTLYGGLSGCTGSGCGTVFELSPSGRETVLHRFKAETDGNRPSGGLVAVNDELYGTTDLGGASGVGTVFEISPSGSERVLHSFQGGADGLYPEAGLIELNGELYGTVTSGGAKNRGAVFRLSP